MEMYDNKKHVADTFNENNLPEYLIQAQWAEFVELKKAITEIHNRKKSPLTVLDIGIGDARIIKHLVGIDEIWGMVGKYDGIDIAQNCVDIASKAIKDLKIGNKATVRLLDASKLEAIDRKYDLVISTWFTAGNFYPTKFDFNKFKPGYDMSSNDKFTNILKKAYALLNPGGELIIGSMYIDNEATRKKQEDAYRGFGWRIITDERDCFTATKDGWWSQRFTKERVHDYLDFIPRKNISFINLDTYEYAMMARIRK
jgi:SAM-dependent methyltransferase